MNTLVIDTSTEISLIAVASGAHYADATRPTGNNHAATLMQSIDTCLSQLKLTIKDIGLIGVGIGPGSFTGIRIAVTTARMLAQMLACPLIGVKSQSFYALSADAQPGEHILVAFDAKKQRVFGALYKKNSENIPEVIIKPGDYPITTLLDSIPDNNKTFLIGNGVTLYNEVIMNKIKNYEICEQCMPDGKKSCDMINYIMAHNPKEQYRYNNIVPFYARKSDAEIIKELKKQQDA